MAKDKKRILDYTLLAVCLCVLALRATDTEAINAPLLSSWINLGDDLTSLIFTTVLFCCVLLWLVSRLIHRTFACRFGGLELPALFFIIVGLVGIFIASNKRTAVNDFVTLTVPVLVAIMLVQVLDSDFKVRLVLSVIIALACASAYRCAGQFYTDTQMMIDQYEADPEGMLRQLGLTAGSFEAWLFEHRLYTKGVTGFLTTSNSVASFSILAAFAAIALFLEQLKTARDKRNLLHVIMTAAALFAVLLNFVFVRSKGGTVAFVVALILFAALFRFGPFIIRHRKKILVVFLFVVITGVAVVINYGLKHGRLPGGNSMLVRWQYWTAAVQMYADHPVTGVGPGNFNSYYPHYKDPGALETVRDPHCFVLSMLTQYGPLGLVAFLALLSVPLWRVLNPPTQSNSRTEKVHPLSRGTVITFVVLIAIALLFVRPILNPIHINGEPFVAIVYVVFSLYVGPVIVFVLGFWLAWSFSHRSRFRLTEITVKAIFCACIGMFLHNLIDFAMFEPGVYTAVWVSLASMIALYQLRHVRPPSVYTISLLVRISMLALLIVSAWAFCHYALFPVGKTTSLLSCARKAYENGSLAQTQVLLRTAAQKDTFNPQPCMTSGTIYLQYLDSYGVRRKEILTLAEKALLTAAQRDRADFKPYEKLTTVYKLFAEEPTGGAKTDYLQKSFDAASRAVELYPSLDRLRISLAEAAEAIGRIDIALANYRKAVEIEDAYRAQFKIMYPDRELFSRLGQHQYDLAKQRIAQLQH